MIDGRDPSEVSWSLPGRRLVLTRPVVMGVLNVTPDSFSDGGRYADPGAAVERAHQLLEQGADLLDIGAESSRPGASPVAWPDEWSRLEPVLLRLRDFPVPLSVDTTKSEVAERALDEGVSVLNDITGLRVDPGLGRLAARSGAGLVVMHMRGTPRTMQKNVDYEDLPGDVERSLRTSIEVAIEAGCEPEQLVIDPGIGFGKSVEGNLDLLARLDRLVGLGRPILVGPSRKSFIGALLDLPPDQRVEGTIAACLVARARGAHIFRVHDVLEVRRALTLAEMILERIPGAGDPCRA